MQTDKKEVLVLRCFVGFAMLWERKIPPATLGWSCFYTIRIHVVICILYPQCGPETRLKKLLGGKKWFLPPPLHEQEKCVMLMMRQLLMKATTYYCAPNKGHVQHTNEDQHKDPTELCCFWRSRPRISVHMGQDFGSFAKKTLPGHAFVLQQWFFQQGHLFPVGRRAWFLV